MDQRLPKLTSVEMVSESKQHHGVDRISELPDGVLCHILSFLPTIDVVRTTILSTRWKNIWTSVCNLDFSDQDFPPTWTSSDRFVTFVDRALSLCSSSDIQKFRIKQSRVSYFSDEDLSRFESWICTAIRHNVVELNLFVGVEDYLELKYKMPQSLFHSKTLVSLKLFESCFSYVPPTTGCFPSLKFLSAAFVFPDTQSMENLFSHCPVLEDLTILASLGDQDNLSVNIFTPELKKLSINLHTYSIEGKDRLSSCIINAPKLETLYLKMDGLTYYFLEKAQFLAQARLEFNHRCKDNPAFADHAIKLLGGISSVQELLLSVYSLEVCSLPNFNNLTTLELALQESQYWELLIEMLKRSPNLECLELCYDGVTWREEYGDQWNPVNPPELVPTCLSSHLTSISIWEFKGQLDEMEVVKYLLQNGVVLKKMNIFTESNSEGLLYSLDELRKEFSVFPKGSKDCRVIIEDVRKL
ncbi:F-box/FBD/LRR-repeat protein [Rosa sericea]